MNLDQKIRQHRALVGHALPAAVHDDVLRVQDAVLAVLDMHPSCPIDSDTPDGAQFCPSCVGTDEDAEEEFADYPCSTVRAIASALGIDVAAVSA